MGPSKLGTSKVIANKASRPDGQRYDRIDIYTVPRWKESELSGDEYRISANADLYYKGHLRKRMSFSDVDGAKRYLDGAEVYWRESGEDFEYVDDTYLCDQESCAEIADVKYERIKGYTSQGEPEELYDFNRFRVFCSKHKTRGDCALDDADHNYKSVEFLPEEQEALDRLRSGGEV
jgi:hypothetical protein